MKITAKLLETFETIQVTPNFKKREFVVEYAENPQYPEFIKFELVQDKCGLLDNFTIGQELEIHFNLKGRKWANPQGEVKYFNSLQAWKIKDAAGQAVDEPEGYEAPLADKPPFPLDDEDDEDVPF